MFDTLRIRRFVKKNLLHRAYAIVARYLFLLHGYLANYPYCSSDVSHIWKFCYLDLLILKPISYTSISHSTAGLDFSYPIYIYIYR